MENTEKFKQRMALCAESYNKEISPALVKLYWEHLKGFSDDQVMTAFRLHEADPDRGVYWPKVADLIAKIKGTEREKKVLIESEAEQAWSAVLYHVNEGPGCMKPIDANDKVKRALKTVGGISSVGMCDVRQLEFKRRDFISAYANSELAAGSPVMIMDKADAKASLESLQARLGK